MSDSHSRCSGPRRLESYPKWKDRDDPDLAPEMELLQTEDDEFKWAFREVGLRVEVDGKEFVPDSTGPTDGYVLLREAGDREGTVKGRDGTEVRIYADMDSDILALGADSRPGGEGHE